MAGGWSSLPSDLLKQVSGCLSTDADHLYIHQRVVIGGAPAGLPYCRGASRGWLALTDDAQSPTRLVLWEPLSNTEIPLPCLNPLTLVFLSGDPLTLSDWVAVASQRHRSNAMVEKALFWRPGDAAWSFLGERVTYQIDSVAFHEGKIYYIDKLLNIVVYDLNARPPTCVPISEIRGPLNRLCRCDRFHSVTVAHVVTCNGELLLVALRLGRGHPSFAEVYKPEWAPDGRLQLLERLTDLGEHSLFLGRGDTFALSAKEFPAIKRNHVYCAAHFGNFTGVRTLKNWAWAFNLETDALEKIPYPGELRDDGTNWLPRSWFCLRRPLMKQQQ